eukprot:TRINITY_DN7250_c1_g2_i1.p1 TRINITY_DN7250_c1_g2~~TRINITY_DN7250_c1_g2_i1.p1  ORF type:complete len:347 (+),score=58.39 TRINITY_DN7250_c1_g2_i1:32-1042(+)
MARCPSPRPPTVCLPVSRRPMGAQRFSSTTGAPSAWRPSPPRPRSAMKAPMIAAIRQQQQQKLQQYQQKQQQHQQQKQQQQQTTATTPTTTTTTTTTTTAATPPGTATSPMKAPMIMPRSRSAGSIGRIVARQQPRHPLPAVSPPPPADALAVDRPSVTASQPKELCSFAAQCVTFADRPISIQSAQRNSCNTPTLTVPAGTGPHRTVCFEDRIQFSAAAGGRFPRQETVHFSQIAHAELEKSSKALRLRLNTQDHQPGWRGSASAEQSFIYLCILLQTEADFANVQKLIWPLFTELLMAPMARTAPLPSRAPASSPSHLSVKGLLEGPSLVWTHS